MYHTLHTYRYTNGRELTDKEREKFITKLNKIFQPAIKLHKEGQPFQWETIHKFVRRYKSDLLNACLFESFCWHLIKLLYEIPCHDKSVVTRMLYIFTDYLGDLNYKHCNLREGDIHFEKKNLRAKLNDVLTKKTPKYVYGDEDYSPLQDSLVTAILSGEFRFMQILVRYGVTFYVSQDKFYFDIDRLLAFKYTHFEPFCNYIGLDFRYHTYEYLTSSRIIEPLYGLPVESGIMRIQMILMFINAVAGDRFPYQDMNFRECLKLFFHTVTAPIFSMREIQRFVDYAFEGIYNKDITEELCKELTIMFPEVTDTYQPRSLMHLSRCQVRNIFVNRPRVLKDEIADLIIPDYIKSYILIENE